MTEPNGPNEIPTIALSPDHIHLLRDGGMEVFTFLLDHAATASQLAQRLQIPRARVNFMLGKLVADGLVRVEDEETQGERIERRYRASLPSFGLQADGQSPLPERLAAAGVFAEQLRGGLLAAIAMERRGVGMVMARARISPDRVNQYLQRLQALIQEFDAEQSGDRGEWHSMLLSLFPAPSKEGD